MRERKINEGLKKPVEIGTSSKKNHKFLYVAAFSLAIIIIAVVFWPQPAKQKETYEGWGVQSPISIKEIEQIKQEELAKYAYQLETRAKWDECVRQVDRFQAGDRSMPLKDGIPACVLSAVPQKPQDYGAIMSEMSIGQISVERFCTKLNESYWKQPDFYPQSGIFYNDYINPPLDIYYICTSENATTYSLENLSGWNCTKKIDRRVGAKGQPGGYIRELRAVNVKPGDNFSACVFVYNSYYTEVFRPLSFQALFPEKATFTTIAFSDGKKDTYQPDATKYFNITISPRIVLLQPNYPYLYGDWVRKIEMDVQVRPDTPSGNYLMQLDPNGPIPKELSDLWQDEYETNYQSLPAEAVFLLGVEVT